MEAKFIWLPDKVMRDCHEESSQSEHLFDAI